MVSKHNLGSSRDFHKICYQKNKKKKKKKRFTMMEGMIFVSYIFRSMKDLSKEVKQMRMERCNETSRGFQDEEGPCTSYQQQRKLVLHRAPKKYTMSTFLEEEGEIHGGNLDNEILSEYVAEYKSQSRAFKENLTLPQFIQIKEERRPCSNRRRKHNRFLLCTFYRSSTCAARAWRRKLDALFLLHPIVQKEVVEIVALHLEGEANIWWFSHLIHARVTAFENFTQSLVKKFEKKKS